MSGASKPRLVLRQVQTDRGPFSLHIPLLQLRAGEIACVVGPNGGGKTTLLLTTLGLLPHQGKCLLDGVPYDGSQPFQKANIGFIPDDPELLFAELTAAEQWAVTAQVLAPLQPGQTAAQLIARATELAQRLSFMPPKSLARDYSHGMRKKTQIINALMGAPPVLVIDELRNGLDPVAIKQTEQLIQNERQRGAAILAATHDLWWAERFADRIYLLADGKIVAAGTRKQLLHTGEKNLEEAFFRIIGAAI